MAESARPFQSRIVGEGVESPDQLLANPLNWRRHPKAQQEALEGLLSEVGWVQRIIVNKLTGHVVDGHARVELALRRSEPTVPVLYVELTEDEERLVLAALDPIGSLASRDDAKLAELLGEVKTQDRALLDLLASLGSANGPPPGDTESSDPGEGSYSEQYGVIVICEDAAHQERVYNKLAGEGFNCKVVVT